MSDLYANEARTAYFDITPSDDLPDLSGVTSATATIEYPGGARTTWTGFTIASQSSSALALSIDLAADDVPFAGPHKAWFHLVTNAGTYDSETSPFTIYSR